MKLCIGCQVARGAKSLTCFIGPRLGEQHVAVRFADYRRQSFRVFLDGKEVSNQCVEAVAGERPLGMVLLIDREPPGKVRCEDCWDLYPVQVFFGEVRIASDTASPAGQPSHP